jgi:hypothetical protein
VYPQLVNELQESDNMASFDSQIPPAWYLNQDEPKTLPGKNKGLVLILDAHSDLFAPGITTTVCMKHYGHNGSSTS